MDCNRACIIAENNTTVRFKGSGTQTFSGGAFLVNRTGGTVILEDDAKIVYEDTAYDMDIEAGSTFKLGDDAQIILEDPVSMIGTSELPRRSST